MTRAASALIVVLLFLFSCTKESVSPESDYSDDYLKGAKLKTKTLKFHESSGIILDDPVLFDDCDICETVAFMLIQGTGHATHLGAFTVVNYICYEQSDLLRGELTAANGDKIHTMVVGTSMDEELGLIYHYLIWDGTGRFEGAGGFIDMWGLIDYDEGIFDLEGLGEITY